MPLFGCVAGEVGVPFPGDLDPLDEIPDRLLAGEQPFLLEVLHVRRVPRVEALGGVGLELDRVRARLRGDLDEAQRGGQVAIVVRPCLRDHIAGMSGPDRATAYLELGVAVDPCAHESGVV